MVDAAIAESRGGADLNDLFTLLKPRVMSLVVFTAAVGMLAAPDSVHPVIGIAAVIFIAVGAGASGALNMWWEADLDALMRRTRSRPIPSGKVSPSDALMIGAWLSGFAVVMTALTTNFLAAGLLAFTIIFYAVIYTMFLKRRTPQNIVIGGASGALPPVIGWAAVTNEISVEPVLMFVLIFLWTPPHFWALSLFNNDDYAKAGVPMLTVTHGDRHVRWQILAYSMLLMPVCVLVAISGIGGPVFACSAFIMNMILVVGAWRLAGRCADLATLDRWKSERAFFRFSILYLFVLFSAIAADALVKRFLEGAMIWPTYI